MANTLQIPSWLRIFLCALLCIGATLDDIGYINAIRAPRTMNSSRSSSMAEDDSDDQHTHLLSSPPAAVIDLGTPFLPALHAIRPPEPPLVLNPIATIRSGRAPPAA